MSPPSSREEQARAVGVDHAGGARCCATCPDEFRRW
jgi:hypothetical protein